MSRVMLRRAGAILIAAAAIQHLHVGLVVEFEEYFEAHLVIGVLFLVGATAGLVAAFLLLAALTGSVGISERSWPGGCWVAS